MVDLISKKKQGEALTNPEIDFIVTGFVDGSVPDYQMAAFLMTVYFKGMSAEETTALTLAMARSGERMDLSAIEGIKADKHSTGGVGDKTTLIVAPIVAACGVKVAKMSGRGLGFTGGTIDKLESVKGFRTDLSTREFIETVNQIGICVTGGTKDLAPADKKIYALRDVIGAVDNIPLIASSIMSKKLASGADCIVLDVKTGSGAFMKSVEESILLSEMMVNIGHLAGKKVSALVTDMDIPLGNSVGNQLEIMEAVHTLQGNGEKRLTQLCLTLAATMLMLAGAGDKTACEAKAADALYSGKAFEKLCELVTAQGGDAAVIRDAALFTPASVVYELKAEQSGYIGRMDTEKIGIASMLLGAGRETKDSVIDFSAGIKIMKKTGDYVKQGEALAILYTSDQGLLQQASEKYTESVTFTTEKPPETPLIYAFVEKDHIIKY